MLELGRGSMGVSGEGWLARAMLLIALLATGCEGPQAWKGSQAMRYACCYGQSSLTQLSEVGPDAHNRTAARTT